MLSANAAIDYRYSSLEKFKDIYFAKLNMEGPLDLVKKLGISYVPTFIVFKDGRKVDELVGPEKQELLEFLEKAVGRSS